MSTSSLYDPRIVTGNAEGMPIGQRNPRAGVFTSLRVKQGFRIDGNMGIGDDAQPNTSLYIANDQFTGGPEQFGVRMETVASSTAVDAFTGFASRGELAEAVFTCAIGRGFHARDIIKGTGSTLTEQVGFDTEALASGAKNYGFRGRLMAGTDRFNLYMEGTAQNYLNGKTAIGTATPDATHALKVTGQVHLDGDVGIRTIADAAYALKVVGSTQLGDTTLGGYYFQAGKVGTGGQFRVVDDGGLLRHTVGLLGTAGAVDFTIYNVVNGVPNLSISNATGLVTLSHGLATGTTLQVATGFGCNGAGPQAAASSGGTLAGVIAALVANGILSS